MNRFGFALSRLASGTALNVSGVNAMKRSTVMAPVMTVITRNMGILDNIKEKVSGKTEDAKAQQMSEVFLKTRETMLATPQFRLKEYFAFLDEQMKSFDTWKGKLSAMTQKEEAEKMKKTYAIINALTPVERAATNLNVINMQVKARITAVTQATPQQINMELNRYQEMEGLHAWFHSRVKRGLKLPASQPELMEMMIVDRPKPSDHTMKMMKKQQSSRFKSKYA